MTFLHVAARFQKSWQVQYFVDLEVQISWHAQYFVDLCGPPRASFAAGAVLCGP